MAVSETAEAKMLPVVTVVDGQLTCPNCKSTSIELQEQPYEFTSLEVDDTGKITAPHVGDAGSVYEEIPRAVICRTCVTEVALPSPIESSV
jgi:hypothetical protein